MHKEEEEEKFGTRFHESQLLRPLFQASLKFIKNVVRVALKRAFLKTLSDAGKPQFNTLLSHLVCIVFIFRSLPRLKVLF